MTARDRDAALTPEERARREKMWGEEYARDAAAQGQNPAEAPCTRCGATPETGMTVGCPECEGIVEPRSQDRSAATRRSIGYIVVEYNQASGMPGLGWDDELLQTLDEARDEAELATQTARLNNRRETYEIAEVMVLRDA